MTKQKLSYDATRWLINTLTVLGTGLTIIFLIWAFKIRLFTDPTVLENFLRQLGPWAPLGLALIQLVQTVIPIIPGAITIPISALILGDGQAFIINYISIVIGSIINFLLARRYGRHVVIAIVGKKSYNKYIKYLDSESGFKKFFTFFMFFPISPADILCYLAGLSDLSFSYFITILLLGKPLTLFLYSTGLLKTLEALGGLLGG